ncbi:hypothetical protein GGS21DRAFT_168535 [Xylaria nigripes]|nr:hypothetical protein GGS21DRAFT_168535 [Xylaria nigripes]
MHGNLGCFDGSYSVIKPIVVYVSIGAINVGISDLDLVHNPPSNKMDRSSVVRDNVEDNVQAPLSLGNMDSKTPLWQHDNAYIRLPAKIIFRTWSELEDFFSACFLLLNYVFVACILFSQNIFSMFILLGRILAERPIIGHILFILLLAAFGTWLGISIRRHNSLPGPLLAESFTAVAWPLYARLTRRKQNA